MKNILISVTSLLVMLMMTNTQAGGAVRASDALWAGGNIYSTVLTPTSFISPPEHSTDTLYNFSMSGLMGQRGVSDSYPGKRDYNGGRWSVKIAVFTANGIAAHDQDGNGYIDAELTSSEAVLEMVANGHIEIMETTIYFECPLIR